MSDKHLHIVSFDVPYPPNYGGIVDVFYRIRALHKLGVRITLHCFEYGRGEQPELEKYTDKVIYYQRKKSFTDVLSRLPFIVKTRSSKALLDNLLKDDAPIFFEGLHTCYFLDDDRLKDRIKIVRVHNIEHDYYRELARVNTGFKKAFFTQESRKLERYESQLKHATHILTVKKAEEAYFSKYCNSVFLIPSAIPELEFPSIQETQPYCLFHGNLSVAENDNGARWLIQNVFSNDSLRNTLKIAGKEPSEALVAYCNEKGIELVESPDADQMEALMQNARIHVFYTDQGTGLKLKLLNALTTSGHIVLNSKMVEGTDLGALCSIAKNENDFKSLIKDKLEKNTDPEEIQKRFDYMNTYYNPIENCKLIVDLL